MDHRAASDFWQEYRALPSDIRARADKQFLLLQGNPQHPSLQFKKIGERHGEDDIKRVERSFRDQEPFQKRAESF